MKISAPGLHGEPAAASGRSLQSPCRLAVCLVVLTLGLLGGGVYLLHLVDTHNTEDSARARALRQVVTMRKLIAMELDSVVLDAAFLTHTDEVNESLSTGMSQRHGSNLTLFSTVKRKYEEIAFVDSAGGETFRVDLTQAGGVAVPPESLRQRAGEHAFVRTSVLGKGEAYISPLELAQQDGRTVEPPRPLLRVGMPVFNTLGERQGVVLVSYDVSELFSLLRNSDATPDAQVLLANAQGALYVGPSQALWGGLLAGREKATLQSLYPDGWERINMEGFGDCITSRGLFAFADISLGDVLGSRAERTIVSDAKNWKLIVFLPTATLYAPSRAFLHKLLAIALVIAVAAVIGVVFLCRARLANAQARQSIQDQEKAYARFVPRNFLELLGKGRYRDIDLSSHIRLEMSVMFSDIRSYTKLSETMRPEEVLAFLNAYFKDISEAILENNGFVDSYHGDAILALFPSSAEDAMKGAVMFRHKLNAFNARRTAAGCAPVEAGLGMHFGEVTMGALGTDQRLQATVIGDAVNLAARIESATKVFKVDLVVSDAVLRQLPDPSLFKAREIDTVRVKGKQDPVVLYEVFDADPPGVAAAKQESVPVLMRALALYKAGSFKEALAAFEECARICPEDSIPSIYVKRCSTLMRIPPGDDWAGISTL